MFVEEAGAPPFPTSPLQAFAPGMLLFWHYLISSPYFPLFTQRACVSYKPLFKAKEHHNCQVTTLHYKSDEASVKPLLRRGEVCALHLSLRESQKGEQDGAAKHVTKCKVRCFSICFTAVTRGMQRKKIIVQESDYFTMKKDSH